MKHLVLKGPLDTHNGNAMEGHSTQFASSRYSENCKGPLKERLLTAVGGVGAARRFDPLAGCHIESRAMVASKIG